MRFACFRVILLPKLLLKKIRIMDNSAAAHHNQTDCPSSVPITFTIVLSTISLLAVAGNLLVVITFIKSLNLKTSPNYYIVNMAVSDLVCVFLNWPLYAIEAMLKPVKTWRKPY